MKKLFLIGLFIPSLTMATSIFEMDNQLGEGLRKIRQAWSKSTQLDGIEPSYSREECKEMLEDQVDSHIVGDFYSLTYFLRPITENNISQSSQLNYRSVKYKNYIGIARNFYGHPNSLSQEHAIHLKSNCIQYMKFLDEGVQKVAVRYPIYDKQGNRSTRVSIKTKKCRVTHSSLDELFYKIYFCEGDHEAYSQF